MINALHIVEIVSSMIQTSDKGDFIESVIDVDAMRKFAATVGVDFDTIAISKREDGDIVVTVGHLKDFNRAEILKKQIEKLEEIGCQYLTEISFVNHEIENLKKKICEIEGDANAVNDGVKAVKSGIDTVKDGVSEIKSAVKKAADAVRTRKRGR